MGKGYPNLPGAHWLNVSKQNDFFHLMESRIKVCADKVFLSVDADNVDGWKHDTGLGIRHAEPRWAFLCSNPIHSERLRRSSLSRCGSGSGCEDAWCAPARGRRGTLVCQGPTPCRCLTEHVLVSPSLCLLEQLRGQPYCEGNERHKTYDPHRQFHFRQPPDVDHRDQRCRPNPGD